jgi:malate/lactate dehydrogenase
MIKGEVKKVKSFFSKDETNDLIKQIQNRGGEIIKKQGLSSGLSAAGAITRHLKDLFSQSSRLPVDPVDPVGPKGEDGVKLFSAGVLSDGNTYGVPEGIVFSFPCYLNNGEVKIFEGLELEESLNERLHVSVAELQGERNEAEVFLNSLTSSSSSSSSTPSPKL